MIRIVAGAAVAQADVEKAVGAEREVAAVVIRERLRDEARPPAPPQRRSKRDAGIGDERIRRTPEARDDRVAGGVREVDVEAAARRVVGRERQAEQAALAAGRRSRRSDRESPAASTVPLRTTRMRPPCSTTNCTARSVGSCTNATGEENPEA